MASLSSVSMIYECLILLMRNDRLLCFSESPVFLDSVGVVVVVGFDGCVFAAYFCDEVVDDSVVY